jgi:uncharacterized protein (TIGR02118 family)
LLKLTFCLRRLPALSRAQFHDYWLNRHGPLVRRLQPALGMSRYVQVHRLEEALDEKLGGGMRRVREAPEPYDGIAELWWANEEAFQAAGRTPEAREAGRLLVEDEARFIDLARSPLWLNREEEIYPGNVRVAP